MILRSEVISFIRSEMKKFDFKFQTPILTSSSPEGARDFLVPSRLNLENFMRYHKRPSSLSNL